MFLPENVADFPVQILCECWASAAAATTPGPGAPRVRGSRRTAPCLPKSRRPTGPVVAAMAARACTPNFAPEAARSAASGS